MNISVDNLSFSYNNNEQVLKEVSFSVNSGDFLSVLGPNGSGKSTLFKCMLGRFSNYSGTVAIDNKNINNIGKKEMSGYVAYIPQHYQNIYDFTVLETVLMGTARTISPVSTPKDKQFETAYAALAELKIDSLAAKHMSNISGGEKQLVYIARALAQNAKALIMDEPTSALDIGHQIQVLNHIKSLANKGYVIIMSTHDPSFALNYSDYVLAIKDGSMLAFGDSTEVMTPKLLSDLYDLPLGLIEKDGQRILYPI